MYCSTSCQQRPALGVPEHHAGRRILHVEQFQLLAQLAVIALLGFFDLVQVGIQLFLFPRPCRRCAATFILGIAAPVRAGQFHQLEGFQFAGGRHVRAAAQISEFAFAYAKHPDRQGSIR